MFFAFVRLFPFVVSDSFLRLCSVTYLLKSPVFGLGRPGGMGEVGDE